jgi:hypothetical protein
MPAVEVASQTDFNETLSTLSVRAKKVLISAGVQDADGLLALKQSVLSKMRNCGGVTANEIKSLQRRLRSGTKRPIKTVCLSADSSETAPLDTFEALCARLSVRAVHTLQDLEIEDLKGFMKLDEIRLFKRRNCGKKTAAEILSLQEQVRAESAPAPVAICLDDAPPDILDAIRSKLTVRAVHVLRDLAVYSLKTFMDIDRGLLLRAANCGKKTAGIIMDLQGALRQFARAQAQKDGVFRPERLLEAPCLIGVGKEDEKMPAEGSSPDLENPAPWLSQWVLSLAKTERQARVFMLRMGVLGEPPITLETVAKRFGGLTRERIRQMQKAVEKKAGASCQQRRLRPLAEAAAATVAQRGGIVTLAELTEAVLCNGKKVRRSKGNRIYCFLLPFPNPCRSLCQARYSRAG